ncbi:hypothetical protein Nepgr_014048 [Nepenthes gracilis]|uniref:Uncharacterized protein n=1 Tax=Nepenthes gracilis TaxID=150966 RepID=A0AAD3XP69_NEPGR|nr:hypothetical protein Nepgr_014048 [Nepenthes gracilis]
MTHDIKQKEKPKAVPYREGRCSRRLGEFHEQLAVALVNSAQQPPRTLATVVIDLLLPPTSPINKHCHGTLVTN